jgi:hypothetical protein
VFLVDQFFVLLALEGAFRKRKTAAMSQAKHNVVTLSFRQMILKDWRWVPNGYPVLELEVIGETHTLTDVGEKLFDCYLGDILDECLDDHVWRFEVLTNGLGEMALDCTIPILSQEMTVVS